MKKNKYNSGLLEALQETAVGLHKIGVISDKEMREYDQGCLVKEPEAAYTTEKSPKTEYAAAAK